MNLFVFSFTLVLSCLAQAQLYTCPEIETSTQRCGQESSVSSGAGSTVKIQLDSQRATKKVFDQLIHFEKNLRQRLNYSSKERIATPVQRPVGGDKKAPKQKPTDVNMKDDSRYLAFVRAVNACLETDASGVPIHQTEGCDTVRANSMKHTLITYAAMTGKSLQTIVDSINTNPDAQDQLIQVLRSQDELKQKAWEAYYKHETNMK